LRSFFTVLGVKTPPKYEFWLHTSEAGAACALEAPILVLATGVGAAGRFIAFVDICAHHRVGYSGSEIQSTVRYAHLRATIDRQRPLTLVINDWAASQRANQKRRMPRISRARSPLCMRPSLTIAHAIKWLRDILAPIRRTITCAR
jgi:hypothetical protein